MRLTCPNCGAQYNVPDSAIPQGGRDVQCSSCNTTWFQKEKVHVPKAISRVLSRPIADDLPPSPVEEPDPEPAPSRPISRIVTTPKTAPRNQLDEGVAAILREEAETSAPSIDPSLPEQTVASTRESALPEAGSDADQLREARKRGSYDKATFETVRGPDVVPSLSQLERAAKVDPEETRSRIAQMAIAARGLEPTPEPEDLPEPDLEPAVPSQDVETAVADMMQEEAANPRAIPDLDEMNATLRARAAARANPELTDAEVEAAQHRSGFRRGFFFVLFALTLPLVPYVFAERISAVFPQTAEFLANYSQTLDGLRTQVSSLLGG